MDLLAAWLLYPLALVLLSLGFGLLMARVAGWRYPGVLLLPVGFAALAALTRLLTQEGVTAPLALPAVVVLAVAGFALERAWLRSLRPDRWIVLAALGVFAVFSAPVVMSGTPTFAGYLALADTSHQLGLADLLAHHGFDWTPLADGTNRRGLAGYVQTGYPVTGQAVLGVTSPLGVLDLAWLYQPLLSFMAMLMGLSLAGLVAPLLRHRWQVGVAAFVAAQPALVVGFALQGSIKEITTLALVVTAVALLAVAIRERRPARSLLLLAVAAAAAIGALGPAAGAYVGVIVVVVLAVWGRRVVRERGRADLLWLGACAAVGVVLTLPVLVTLQTQLTVQGGTLSNQTGGGREVAPVFELGNLAAPLKIEQTLGIWLSGDFRYTTTELETPQAIALALAGLCALLGLAWAIRRRVWEPLLLAAVLVLPSIYLLSRGAPYADAKVLAILSPAILLLVVLGALVLWNGRLKALSLLLTGGLVAAVLASSALAYHDVSLTPYDRYEELLDINERLAGRGPAILNEHDEFGKYFLRDVPGLNEPEWPHSYRHGPYDPNALVDEKRRPSVKTPLDMDDLRLEYLQSVPYIILRRSPTSSRPPANFRLESRGEFYEVWRRRSKPRVVRHKPLGPDILRSGAEVTARDAQAWARRARRLNGRIAYVERARLTGFYVTHHPRPLKWEGFGNFPEALVAAAPGRVIAPVRIPRTGRYNVWFEGSFARELALSIDFRTLGETSSGLNNPGAYVLVGTRRLTRGPHRLEVLQGGGDLRPGSGGYRSSLRHIGPIWFQPVSDVQRRVVTIDPDDWRRLVGVRADWLEIVR